MVSNILVNLTVPLCLFPDRFHVMAPPNATGSPVNPIAMF
jgi:hypothetical protein